MRASKSGAPSRLRVGRLLLLGSVCALACQSTQPPEPAPSPSVKSAELAAPAESAKPNSNGAGSGSATAARAEVVEARFDAPSRVVAIGDLHGDLGATREVLALAGALGDGDQWVGGDLTVVQTGDQLDRGDDEKEILDLFATLEQQAKAAGGAFIVLNGNHELMNAQGDFRYVTQGAIDDFTQPGLALPEALRAGVPARYAGRAAAFLPGGELARSLAARPVIAIVRDTVFVHGGVHSKHVEYGVDRINREVRNWLLGQAPAPPVVESEDSPVWSRRYSSPTPSAAACDELGRVLAALSAKRMVVGHTVQTHGLSSACGERVWRIDVGMSAHYGGDSVSALEIGSAGTRVLTRKKGASRVNDAPGATNTSPRPNLPRPGPAPQRGQAPLPAAPLPAAP